MTTVADLAAWLEAFAPSRLAESWDNVGLLMGDPSSPIHRIMTCLTVTPRTADEAIAEGAGAIVSHHPILFKPTKRIRADQIETAILWKLARAGIAVLSPHTSFDNTVGGINDGLARRLNLEDVRPLRPGPGSTQFKVVIFAPRTNRESIMAEAFEAGAGRIEAYDECSFGSPGLGTFFGREGSDPTVGKPGRREVAREWRLEFSCPGDRLADVLAAIRMVHTYEEPAIDVYTLAPAPSLNLGAGRIGYLAEPETLEEFAARVALLLKSSSTQFVGKPNRRIRTVAICCGAGDDFLPDAIGLGAEVLLTGEARFHRALEAEAAGIGLVVAGHHSTERPGVEDLAVRIAEVFPEVQVWASHDEVDPLRPVVRP